MLAVEGTWSAQDWTALGTVTLAAATVFGGGWALFNYRAHRRADAARWIHGLFRDFYLEDRYREVKWRLVRPEYVSTIAPLLERRLARRDVPLREEEDQLLRDLDTLLNFFEHILYLETQGHLKASDRRALFNYWLTLLKAPEYAALRKYIARFDYEHLAAAIDATDDVDYFALYGSLRSDVSADRVVPQVGSMDAIDLGNCQIPGHLLDLGRYPGLVLGGGEAQGELYQVMNSEDFFRELDDFEGYDPAARQGSRFHRSLIRLTSPPVDAWVYVYAQHEDEFPVVANGDWKSYSQARQAGGTPGTAVHR